MRAALLVLLLVAASHALVTGPRIYEQDDNGDPIFEQFTYSISVDCNASTIMLYVMNASNKPVADANVYVKYVDFSSPVLSNTKTDKDGYTLIKLPGSTQLMRGLFIMVMEKKGYRNKEVHFDISPCFGGSMFPPKPPQANQTNASKPNATNATVPDVPAPPQDNATGDAGGNFSGNQTEADETGQGGDEGGGEGGQELPACPALPALLCALFFKTIKADIPP